MGSEKPAVQPSFGYCSCFCGIRTLCFLVKPSSSIRVLPTAESIPIWWTSWFHESVTRCRLIGKSTETSELFVAWDMFSRGTSTASSTLSPKVPSCTGRDSVILATDYTDFTDIHIDVTKNSLLACYRRSYFQSGLSNPKHAG